MELNRSLEGPKIPVCHLSPGSRHSAKEIIALAGALRAEAG